MRGHLAGGALALAAMAAAGAATAQQQPGAVYWVTADTQTGDVGGLSGIMSMMGGGQPSADVQRLLRLQLVSGGAADGASAADHLPPAGLRAGERLPLVIIPQGRAGGDAGEGGAATERVLVYWGCGERVRAGQPMVLDLARPGGAAAGLGEGLGRFASAPAPGPGRTYAEWPNARSEGRISTGASLIGEHRVRGDVAPEIAFSLGADQDFLPPLVLSGTSPDAAGASPLSWRQVAGGRGYFASVVGANDSGDTVIWTSSETPLLAGQVLDHLAPEEIERLIARRVVMNAETTHCAVPAEVGAAAPAALLRVVAYGGEVGLERPSMWSRSATPRSLRPCWACPTTRARTRATTLRLRPTNPRPGGAPANARAICSRDSAGSRPDRRRPASLPFPNPLESLPHEKVRARRLAPARSGRLFRLGQRPRS